MTITHNGDRDTRDMHRDTLSDSEARVRLQEAWRVSGGTLTAAEGAAMFDRTERWARKWIGRARDEAAQPTVPPERPKPAERNAPKPAAARKRNVQADGSDDRLERWARLLVPWACAGIALVMSYSHVRHLAIRAGVAWPELLPLSIDGLMLAGWLCLRRHPRQPLAIIAVALGVLGSAALNACAARPELVAMADVRLGAAIAVPVSAVVAMHLALKR